MKRIWIGLFALASFSAFAGQNLEVLCFSQFFEGDRSLAIDSPGVLNARIILLKTGSVSECKQYSNNIRPILSSYNVQQLKSASFNCSHEPDGTTRVYVTIKQKKIRFLTLLGKSDEQRKEKCNEVSYQMNEVISERIN